MEHENKSVTRKKFLAWGAGISSLLVLPAFFKFSAGRPKKPVTAKMLTQDGKLVEIDLAHVPARKKKMKPADIATWVNKKTSL